jgi:hypothetical protein
MRRAEGHKTMPSLLVLLFIYVFNKFKKKKHLSLVRKLKRKVLNSSYSFYFNENMDKGKQTQIFCKILKKNRKIFTYLK